MQQPGEFFNLHRLRARQLLTRYYPEVHLDIVESDVISARVESDSRISISTTLLLVLVNVFFRMLTHPGILSGYGSTQLLSPDYSLYPGLLPTSLAELLDGSDPAAIQPEDKQRAQIAKQLADTAFDFQVLHLASRAENRLGSAAVLDEEYDQRIDPLFLAADRAAIGFLTTRDQVSGSDGTPGSVTGTSRSFELPDEDITLLSFSFSMLFYIMESLYELPAAARIVHAQQHLSALIAEPATAAAQSGCNEAILARAAITRQAPNLDGFNGILNPASSRVLREILG